MQKLRDFCIPCHHELQHKERKFRKRHKIHKRGTPLKKSVEARY